jgi:hypothetical protein
MTNETTEQANEWEAKRIELISTMNDLKTAWEIQDMHAFDYFLNKVAAIRIEMRKLNTPTARVPPWK